MIKTRENITEWLRANNTPYWKLYNIARTGLLSESSLDESLTIEGSIADFEKRLDILGGGQFALEAWNTPKQTKDRMKTSFEIGGPSDVLASIGSIQAPVVDIEAAVNKALAEYRKDELIKSLEGQIKDLSAQNRILEAENSGSTERIIKKLEPYIGYFLPGSTTPGAIAGNENPEASDMQARLEKAFEQWGKNETQCVEIVEKIAFMSEGDPGTYNMARTILLK